MHVIDSIVVSKVEKKWTAVYISYLSTKLLSYEMIEMFYKIDKIFNILSFIINFCGY